jgi:hypothetical protein
VIKAISADGSDQPLSESILPGRSSRYRAIAYAHGCDASNESVTIGAIAITNNIAWRFIPAARFGQLTLFLRLVVPGEGQEDTHARSTIPDDPEQRDIINIFSNPRTRLLVTGYDALEGGRLGGRNSRATVEIAHEALIRRWPTLRAWVDANGEALRARAAILRAKAEWEENDRVDKFLLDPGIQLERGRSLLHSPRDVPVDDIRDYVELAREATAAEQKRMAQAVWNRWGGSANRPPPRPRGSKIFISYRRSDTKQVAGRIFDRLINAFSEDDIIFDVDATPMGMNFRDFIMNSISDSAAVLALVGEKWVNRAWKRSSRWLGLYQPSENHVQTELELALEFGVPILPVLIDNISMPSQSNLPTSISEFCLLHAATVRSGREFNIDMDNVLNQLRAWREQGLALKRS